MSRLILTNNIIKLIEERYNITISDDSLILIFRNINNVYKNRKEHTLSIIALYYLSKLPKYAITSDNIDRVFFIAIVLADIYHYDTPMLTNKQQKKWLQHMMEFLKVIDYNINIDVETFDKYKTLVLVE